MLRIKKPCHEHLLPRFLNYKKAPRKRLNMDETRRQILVQKLLTTLIQEERLQTTVGKAKFVKFYADQLVQMAKEKRDLEVAQKLVQDPGVVLPKVYGPLAARFEGKSDSYTKILRLGHRTHKKATQGPTQYADAAQMAILEFDDSKKNVSYLMAKGSLEAFQKKLDQVQEMLYDKETIQLEDPETGKPFEHVEMREKDLPLFQLQKYRKQEKDFAKKIKQCQETLESVERGFEQEQEFLRSKLEENNRSYEESTEKEVLKKQLELQGYIVDESGSLSLADPLERERLALEKWQKEQIEEAQRQKEDLLKLRAIQQKFQKKETKAEYEKKTESDTAEKVPEKADQDTKKIQRSTFKNILSKFKLF